jgi:zinc protease
VLEDWAHGVSFNDADIDLERAIVLEELRLGKGAQDRMNKVLLPKIFSGSLYAQRLPIGTEASLKGFSHAAIKRFYKDWYRPNLMAVVVVGDIEVEAATGAGGGPLWQAGKPAGPERPRVYAPVVSRSTSEAVVVTDKEATNNALMIRYPVQPAKTVVTLGDYRQSMVERLFGAMLAQRMQELTQRAKPAVCRRWQRGQPPGAGLPVFQFKRSAGPHGRGPRGGCPGAGKRTCSAIWLQPGRAGAQQEDHAAGPGARPSRT